MKHQKQIIQELTDRELLMYLYLTQCILLIISIILGLWLFDDWQSFQQLWGIWDINILYYGGGSAAIILIIDYIMMKYLPKDMYDDGGVNERIFQNRSIFHILFLTIIIAFVEEILFRGMIQSKFGLMIASFLFAILHFRYLSKWVLFLSVTLLSFIIGVIFEITNNLWVTIFLHFVIDFGSALMIRQKLFD